MGLVEVAGQCSRAGPFGAKSVAAVAIGECASAARVSSKKCVAVRKDRWLAKTTLELNGPQESPHDETITVARALGMCACATPLTAAMGE